ncbi:MAG: FlgD immunoglobulin-like domain containing protein [bacterium]
MVQAQAVGTVLSTNTESDFSKSNQSKVFYHDGKWWAIAVLSGASDWYIWQFDANAGLWNSTVLVHTSSSRRPDAVLDAANNRLYVFLSNSSKSEINRYSYSGGTWVLDSGFPVSLSDFPDSGSSDPISLVQAKNGNLWIFRMTGNTLQAKKSSNNGSTWTGIITVKTGLTTATGTADGVAFTNSSSENCVGVAYAETNVAGSRFGFLVHRDSEADNVWADETSSLTFAAGERATNELSVTADNGNNVYLLTQNANATGSAPRNTLYKRSPAGTWQGLAVNTAATWTNPALAVDNGHNVLYVMGINTANGQAEYKSCALGQEANLATASPTTLFTNGTSSNEFTDLSVPSRGNLGAVAELMVCAANQDDEHIWYHRIAFGGGSTPLIVGTITASPNEANATAAYTIPITLGSAGALAAGTGTISIQFPDNTFVPNSISASAVTINGTAATTVIANSATRELTITTPVTLGNSANVSIVLTLGAGLLNPSLSGNKTLSVWTSTELAHVTSPNYAIAPATTTVSAATVTPSPNLINAAATYTLGFNLGARGRLIAGSSTITITFNNATTVSNGSITGAQINGVNASASGNSAAKTVILTVPASLSLGNGAATTISLPSTAIANPAIAGSYTLTVATSVETTPTTSTSYVISSSASLTIGAITLSSNEANTNASYTIPLSLGTSGALSAGSGTIGVQFPNNTFVPGVIAPNQVTVGGVAASVVTANSSTREVTVTVPANLAGGANVSLVFNAAAALLNPSAAGNYSLQAWSSAEPTHVASPLYAINAATTTVTAANVTPNPNTTSQASAHTISFNLGAHGRLIAGSSTVIITFNSSTVVSNGSISGAQVNGTNAVASGSSVNKTVTLTVPAALNLGNSAAVTVLLPAAAITNPATAGNYTLTVATSVETAPVTSNAYSISPLIFFTVGTVSLSTHEANSNASYTIPLTLGSSGALNAGSGTLTIQFPDNTFVPGSIATNQITVNGVAANNVSANSATREVTVTVPGNLAGGASVSLVFNTGAGLLNPSLAGNYSLQAWSSAEVTHIASPTYAIGPALTTVSVATVTPNPNTTNSAAAYNVAFNLGAHGRLVAGSSTITVTFNSATAVANGSISGAQINGVNATATGNSASKTATLTVPASVNLGNSAAVTVSLPSTAITNPATSGYYTLMNATSVEATQVVSNVYSIQGSGAPPPGDAALVTGTGADFDKPHQSRVFYHDSQWWLTALKKSDNTWKLWKFNGTSWIEQLQVASTRASRPDCFVDNANNKLYIFVSHNSQSTFLRLSYSAGAWSMDAGYPANVPSFTHSGEYSISFSRAKNGELWAFRASGAQVEGIVSVNEGQAWSGVITVKSGTNNEAVADCHAFSTGSGDFMGVCYSENSTANSLVGFLRHQDGASQSSWTDETSLLPPYSGTQSDDHINMAVANDGTVYLITKTDGGGNTIVDNGLYKRSTGGTWQLFAVNRGGGWTRPALGIDQSSSQIYAFGTPEGTDKLGYLKRVALGSESLLENATQLTVFQGGSNSFVNLSVAQNNHTAASGMMVTVEDDVGEQIWYNLLNLGGGSSPTPLVVNSAVVSPNTAGLNGAYTIGLTLGSQGGLSAGSGTITVTWPAGTIIPPSMSTTAVTVNGSNAAGVTTTPATRRAVVTVPGNLANSASVTLAFSASASIINPSVGTYSLQVQTSAQPTDVNSPNYNLQATTPVTVSNITVLPNTPSQVAAYTIPITLGSTGALTGGSSTITVKWPGDTNIPASIATANVTINGNDAAGVTTNTGLQQAVVTVPSNLINNASVSLEFAAGASIMNPTTAGNYTLQVQTTAQPVNANSPSYTITVPGGSSLTVGNIGVAPDTVNRIASYNIPIVLGSTGALTGGSGTITVTWPFNTQIPGSISNTQVTVNGSAAAIVSTVPAARQAIVTVPANLANNANVTLLFSSGTGLTNPSTAGDYAVQAHTSAEPANVNSPNYTINAAAPPSNPNGSSVAAATDANLEKSNQSKAFHFGNKWWLIAFDAGKQDWHLWKYSSGAWTRGLQVETRVAVRIDAVLDSTNGRLYYVSSHINATQVGRLLYNGTGWIQEMALVSVAGFGQGSGANAVSMARGQNGQLWLFRVNGTALEAKVSSDNGQTWSATIVLKSGITGNGGNTDGLTFTANGNRVGVFYGMASGTGGVAYGFLHHLDGDANSTWTDESASLTFFANERGNNLLHAQAAKDGRLFLVTRNSKTGAANATQNTLYTRTSGGVWNKYKVNIGTAWKSPIVAIDETHDRLYVVGIRTTAPNYAEFKSCSFGSESTLQAQTATVLLQHNSDIFEELTAPSHVTYETEGLMLCGTNTTANDVWYKQLDLGLAKQSGENISALTEASDNGPEVGAYPNPFNPATTIRFRMKDADNVRLRIFSVRGELIRTLVDQEMTAGVHERRWNGRDRNGQLVASGVYFYRLEIGGKIHHGRLQMLK